MKELTAEQRNVMVGTRHCSRCSLPIVTGPLVDIGNYDRLLHLAMAWLAGYCTTMCHRNAVYDAVHLKRTWWLKEATR